MNKVLPLISLFVLKLVSIYYWMFKLKEELLEIGCNALFTKTSSSSGWKKSKKGTLLEALWSNKQLNVTFMSLGKETSIEDDYGISCYFRQFIINNYIEFASKCRKIARKLDNDF